MTATFYNHFPAYAIKERFNLPLFSLYVALHVTILMAPFTYSTEGLIAFLLLSFMTFCLGITLCFHRLLTHCSYEIPKPLKYLFTLFGCLAFQRGPIWWVATHRLHHSRVDQDGDPHTPKFSFVWAHFAWAFFTHPQLDEDPKIVQGLARDLYADPVMRFFEKYYTAINILFLVFLFVLGYFIGGLKIALSLLVWGGFVRILYNLHMTWLVNSMAHIWGYQTFNTPDTSKNNWWVALLSWGDGWHNNHHAYPRSARAGFAWYEIDITYWVISLLRYLGVAKKVINKQPVIN